MLALPMLLHWVVATSALKLGDPNTPSVDVVSADTRVAVLVVGKSLRQEPTPTAAGHLMHMPDQMANEEVKLPEELAMPEDGAGTFDKQVELQQLGKPRAQANPTQAQLWDSLRLHVLEPLRKDFGGRVDVFLCLNDTNGLVPDDFTAVYIFGASNHMARASQCYQRVRATGKDYGIFVKTRPDFMYFRGIQSLLGIRTDHLLSRFRSAYQISGLNTSHMSWSYCSQRCQPWNLAEDSAGYMNDDSIYVAPKQIADDVFDSWPAIHSAMNYRVKGWIILPDKLYESFFTKHLLSRHIVTEPLSVRGYPADSKYPHLNSQRTCLNLDIKKTDCGSRQQPLAILDKSVTAR